MNINVHAFCAHTHTLCMYPPHRYEELCLVEQREEVWVPLLLAGKLSPTPVPECATNCIPLALSASQQFTEELLFAIQGLYISV